MKAAFVTLLMSTAVSITAAAAGNGTAAGAPPAAICRVLSDAPLIWDAPDSAWIQSVRILGRFQYQYAHIDGTGSDGRDFDYNTDEFRRVWLGAGIDAVKSLHIQGQWILIKDGTPKGGDREFDNQMWELYATLNAAEYIAIDGLKELLAGYGRRIVHMGAEWHTSSTKIKTVERSAIANKIWPDDNESSNPTGAWLESRYGSTDFTLGAFSSETSEGLADWNGGTLYYASLTQKIGKTPADIILDGFYQDTDDGHDTLAGGVRWVSSAAVEYSSGSGYFTINTIYGNNGTQSEPEREGDFWALVLLPSYYIWRDKLEAVMRYEYQAAENPLGADINSRYAGRAEKKGDVFLEQNGRGDRHQSFYLGLNYYLCGHRLKLMSGIEYEDMQSRGSHVYDGMTGFLAMRMHL
jgi:phosphate-selective porin OprO/OprP